MAAGYHPEVRRDASASVSRLQPGCPRRLGSLPRDHGPEAVDLRDARDSRFIKRRDA
jgi:hypothetical protein